MDVMESAPGKHTFAGRGAPVCVPATSTGNAATQGKVRQLEQRLTQQGDMHRGITKELRSEVQRLQHICNELTFKMIMHGISPEELQLPRRFDVKKYTDVAQGRAEGRTATGGRGSPADSAKRASSGGGGAGHGCATTSIATQTSLPSNPDFGYFGNQALEKNLNLLSLDPSANMLRLTDHQSDHQLMGRPLSTVSTSMTRLQPLPTAPMAPVPREHYLPEVPNKRPQELPALEGARGF